MVQIGGTIQCLNEHQFRSQAPSASSLHFRSLKTLFYTNTNTRQNPIKCAVCYVATRATKFLNVGNQDCPMNWTKEFQGALATFDKIFSDNICINENFMQDISWRYPKRNNLKFVRSKCKSKSCDLKELISCVLCTR